jgi:ribosomal protein S18 acetylase RimI-like enzyme
MPNPNALRIVAVDLDDSAHTQALVALLDHYASDPMGGSTPLSAQTRAELIPRLREQPGYVAFLAYHEDQAVGLINCFQGFSTFAARPLLNIHDVAVHEKHRGAGVGRALLAAAETAARARGCCKITLEVLSNNTPAIAAYDRAGFEPYVLDPAAGHAICMHKKLAY